MAVKSFLDGGYIDLFEPSNFSSYSPTPSSWKKSLLDMITGAAGGAAGGAALGPWGAAVGAAAKILPSAFDFLSSKRKSDDLEEVNANDLAMQQKTFDYLREKDAEQALADRYDQQVSMAERRNRIQAMDPGIAASNSILGNQMQMDVANNPYLLRTTRGLDDGEVREESIRSRYKDYHHKRA
jgi:hypothetical protein|tara:strand:- start:24 stop:572 length:549 start_codon:yes stop_codon:yes gene_type:complete